MDENDRTKLLVLGAFLVLMIGIAGIQWVDLLFEEPIDPSFGDPMGFYVLPHEPSDSIIESKDNKTIIYDTYYHPSMELLSDEQINLVRQLEKKYSKVTLYNYLDNWDGFQLNYFAIK